MPSIITRTTGGVRRILRTPTGKIATSLACCCDGDPNKITFGPWSPCSTCINNRSPDRVQLSISGILCYNPNTPDWLCNADFENPPFPVFGGFRHKYAICCDSLNGTFVVDRNSSAPTSCMWWRSGFTIEEYPIMMSGVVSNIPCADGGFVDVIFQRNHFAFPGRWSIHASICYTFGSTGQCISWRNDAGPAYDPDTFEEIPMDCYQSLSLNYISGGSSWVCTSTGASAGFSAL